jgi:hypothetical protein
MLLITVDWVGVTLFPPGCPYFLVRVTENIFPSSSIEQAGHAGERSRQISMRKSGSVIIAELVNE